MKNAVITDAMLDALRLRVEADMSAERCAHVLGVEQTAAEMARLYCPEKQNVLRAAALLHDVTKELSHAEQLELLKKYGECGYNDAAPATLHAITAAIVIPERFAEYATEEIISAVKYHTTGRADMSLVEKIIYLADYIEAGRRHEVCRRLRAEFFGAYPEKMGYGERLLHLDRVILQSLDLTLEHLKEKGGQISADTKKAREFLAWTLNFED